MCPARNVRGANHMGLPKKLMVERLLLGSVGFRFFIFKNI